MVQDRIRKIIILCNLEIINLLLYDSYFDWYWKYSIYLLNFDILLVFIIKVDIQRMFNECMIE